MIAVYLACIIASIAICFWYFSFDVRRSIVQNIMLLIMLVANIGYYSLARSSDLSGAVLSLKIAYLAGCYLPSLYLLTVCEVCSINVSRLMKSIIVVVQSIVYYFVCTVGYSGVFYKTVSYISVNGIGSVQKEYGIGHTIHAILVVSYFALSIIVAFYTFLKRKNVIRSELIIMIVFAGIATIGYIAEKQAGLKYELMPVFYIILMAGAIIPIYHSDIYAVMENQEVIKEQLSDVGFISFSKRLKYMGATDSAFELFEELRSQTVGKRIDEPSDILKEIIDEAELFLKRSDNRNSHQHNNFRQFSIKDKTIEIRIHTLENCFGRRVGITLELRDVTEHAKVVELTRKYNEELSLEVKRKTQKIRTIQEQTILGMAQMVESRDLSTGGHIRRTSEVVRLFADRLLLTNAGFDKDFLGLVVRSAPMHDLGKIGVDDAVLRKQGRFTEEEFAKMKTHSEIGGRMVKRILTNVEEEEFVTVAFNVANYHHEKVNGKGYPCGLKGDEIPVEARIMALADVFDALVSKRCYKEAFSYDEAFDIIKKDAGEHFDKKLAEVFLDCRSELEAYYDKEKANENIV